MAQVLRPSAPTSSLLPLARLAPHPLSNITAALDNLRALYFPTQPSPASLPVLKPTKRPHHICHDASVPDSGYASPEEDEEDEDEDEEQALELLRADAFERGFAIKWLTGLAARADLFLSSSTSPTESSARADAIDTAAALLAAFSGGTEPEEALTRAFAFSAPSCTGGKVEVVLNDAPLSSGDHTAVGLQSWASSIVLAERMCADPAAFRIVPGHRILELGAGTGLLSIAAAKILSSAPSNRDAGTAPTIVATDFHPDVLANLSRNIASNGVQASVSVRTLDWAHPQPLPGAPFDVVLAADVVYHPAHAFWIRGCVAELLRPGGVFWMIVAVRATGRHEGLVDGIGEVFPMVGEGAGEGLAVVEMKEIGRMEGCGRADEGGYRLYKIGWASAGVGP